MLTHARRGAHSGMHIYIQVYIRSCACAQLLARLCRNKVKEKIAEARARSSVSAAALSFYSVVFFCLGWFSVVFFIYYLANAQRSHHCSHASGCKRVRYGSGLSKGKLLLRRAERQLIIMYKNVGRKMRPVH